MREILFKAKRIDNGEWVEGYYCKRKHYCFDKRTDDLKTVIITEFSNGGFVCYEVNPNTICQYTGLTDKDGNKIWENDIVWVCGTDRAIVIFSEKYSGYILQPIGDYYFDSPMLADNVDIIDNIIGNIFDNPELVKEG